MAGNKKSSKSSKSKLAKDSAVEATLATVKALPADQQLSALISHYTELAVQQTQIKNSLTAAEKSNNQLNSDYTKAMLSKAQLESLCRELQKQNKLTKEENLARIREEEEKRRDVSSRLNNTLADITGLMQQNTEKNTELRQENQNMALKLKDLVSQYESRQESVDQIMRQRDLQLQLAEAKLAKAGIEGTEAKETFLRDKKKMLEDMQVYQEKMTRMSAVEVTLRTQLAKYADQYEQFQKTVESSNTIMNKFKKEMESMTKKIKKLEKETVSWKTKWQKSNTTLIDMIAERTDLVYKCEKLSKQNVKLQQLGRTLQAQLVEERKQRKDADSAPSECGSTIIEESLGEPIEKLSVEASVQSAVTSAADADNDAATTPQSNDSPADGNQQTATKAVVVSEAQTVLSVEAEGVECQMSDINDKLAKLKCTVQETSLSDVTTKESTIQITEL